MMVGQRVVLVGKDGPVSRRRRPAAGRTTAAAASGRTLEHTDLHVDIGATSREEATALVAHGDVGVWEGAPFELPNGRVVSKSLDNRLGAYVALEAARRVAEDGGAELDVVAVAAVQEELGLAGRAGGGVLARARRSRSRSTSPRRPTSRAATRGARARSSSADGAAIDAGPDREPARLRPAGRRGRGGGNRRTASRSRRGRTQTDADAVHVSRGGVPTGLVSIPLRYMHSPCELGLARRPRGGDRARRRVRAPAHPRAELPALAWPRDPQRHRRRRADAVRQARRRPRGTPRDRARRDRHPGGARARRDRAARARLRDHGPGAAGRAPARRRRGRRRSGRGCRSRRRRTRSTRSAPRRSARSRSPTR